MPTVTRLHPQCTDRTFDELADVLQSCVHDGASVGFFAPLGHEHAIQYWQEAVREAVHGKRWIWVAHSGGRIVGSVQLAISERANGRHRAEVQKLLVHLAFRRQGVASALLKALEAEALASGRELLVLDTRTGDRAESLYRRLGYCEAGLIPGYTKTPVGEPRSTSIYYKQLASQTGHSSQSQR
ncbi:GNAT family N-acetyltransferase [Permianibacter sp. IMCC34836]|uniref:GNAT family N-acetyltransferase n=1 Tax=Permianibacter fluminis TaxID=2738515 RepID=UPI001555BE1B|nr:GNAT family N-acetyltransferase [Permianibacter fluminis]NQD38824.1 GNAT family N-acetyltransferase [Permianibacter fluminis]